MQRTDNFMERDCQTCRWVTTSECNQCISFSAWCPGADLKRGSCDSCTNQNDNTEWCKDCAFNGIEETKNMNIPQDDDVVEVPDVSCDTCRYNTPGRALSICRQECDDYSEWEETKKPNVTEELEQEMEGQKQQNALPSDYHKKKADMGKDMWHFIPMGILRGVARVLTFGAQKYAADSWQTVDDAEVRYFSAMIRHHCHHYLDGEFYDEESGLPHWAHFLCNAVFIAWFMSRKAPLK